MEQSLEDVLKWEPPEVLVKYSPFGLLGADKYGGTGDCLTLTF